MMWLFIPIYLISVIICLISEYFFCKETIGHNPCLEEYVFWLQNEDTEGKICILFPFLNSLVAVIILGIVIYEYLNKK